MRISNAWVTNVGLLLGSCLLQAQRPHSLVVPTLALQYNDYGPPNDQPPRPRTVAKQQEHGWPCNG